VRGTAASRARGARRLSRARTLRLGAVRHGVDAILALLAQDWERQSAIILMRPSQA